MLKAIKDERQPSTISCSGYHKRLFNIVVSVFFLLFAGAGVGKSECEKKKVSQ